MVGKRIFNPRHFHDLIIFDVQVQLATHAAEMAGRADMTRLPGLDFISAFLFNESGNRTCLDALPTEYTIGALQVVVSQRHNFGVGAPETMTDGIVHLNAVAGFHAQRPQRMQREKSRTIRGLAISMG